MSVIEVNETSTARTGTYGFDGKVWSYKLRREWLVLTDALDGPVTALTGLPVSPRAPYQLTLVTPGDIEEVLNAFAVNFDAQVVDMTTSGGTEYLLWKCTVDYEPISLEYANLSPIDNTPKVDWNFAKYQESATVDKDDNPIVNSTLQVPYDPAKTVADASRPVVTVTVNQSTFSAVEASQYVDTINSATFLGVDEFCVKLDNISARSISDPNIGLYWEVTYEFSFKPETWLLKLLDEGVMMLDGGGNLTPISKAGVAIQEPVPLDGAGGELTPPVDSSNAEFNTFHIYDEVDFSSVFSWTSIPGLN